METIPEVTTEAFNFWNLITASPWLAVGWLFWKYLPTFKGFYDSYRESVIIQAQTRDALISVANELDENRKFTKAVIKAYREAGHELVIELV